jgi:hypothetical protein
VQIFNPESFERRMKAARLRRAEALAGRGTQPETREAPPVSDADVPVPAPVSVPVESSAQPSVPAVEPRRRPARLAAVAAVLLVGIGGSIAAMVGLPAPEAPMPATPEPSSATSQSSVASEPASATLAMMAEAPKALPVLTAPAPLMALPATEATVRVGRVPELGSVRQAREATPDLGAARIAASPAALEGDPVLADTRLLVAVPGSLPGDVLARIVGALDAGGVGRVTSDAVNATILRTNVRFFYPEDAEAAERVRALLGPEVGAETRDFTFYSPAPPPGTIELWLAGDAAARSAAADPGPTAPAALSLVG